MRDDRRALLELLLRSGQSFDDIAGVLGSDRDAVRERARDALEELGGERPTLELADYLLGEASPVERADMARRLSDDTELASRAAALIEALREAYPDAPLPALPGREPAAMPDSARSRGDERGAGTGPSTASVGRQVLALAAIAIVVAGVVFVATGGLGDDDDEAPPASGQASLEDLDAVPVELAPPDGGEARGEAILGLATADQPFVDVNLRDLEPIEPSDAYILWLMAGEDRGWPLGIIEPGQDGSHSDRYPVPAFLLQTNVVKGLRTIVVSRSPREEALGAADEAAEAGEPEVAFVGEAVLSGDVPSAGAPAPRDPG